MCIKRIIKVIVCELELKNWNEKKFNFVYIWLKKCFQLCKKSKNEKFDIVKF
jgi:hypothetical protein